jgi:hypothetical protein
MVLFLSNVSCFLQVKFYLCKICTLFDSKLLFVVVYSSLCSFFLKGNDVCNG